MTCAICGKRPIVDRFGPVGWCQECDEAARVAAEEWREEEIEKAATTIHPDSQQHEDAEKLPAVRVLQTN